MFSVYGTSVKRLVYVLCSVPVAAHYYSLPGLQVHRHHGRLINVTLLIKCESFLPAIIY